jgi:hypothetical protein
MRLLKDYAKRAMRISFEAFQKVGIDVLPRHFYSEIPNISELRKSVQWRQKLDMHGVPGAELAAQLPYLDELFRNSNAIEARLQGVYRRAIASNGEGGGYGPVEADVLFAYINSQRPENIVQIGCGVSTFVILAAAEHAGYRPNIACIEPYPSQSLDQIPSDVDQF